MPELNISDGELLERGAGDALEEGAIGPSLGLDDYDDSEYSALGELLRPCCGQTLANCECPAPVLPPRGHTFSFSSSNEAAKREVVGSEP